MPWVHKKTDYIMAIIFFIVFGIVLILSIPFKILGAMHMLFKRLWRKFKKLFVMLKQ